MSVMDAVETGAALEFVSILVDTFVIAADAISVIAVFHAVDATIAVLDVVSVVIDATVEKTTVVVVETSVAGDFTCRCHCGGDFCGGQ